MATAFAQISVRVVDATNTVLENLFGGGGIILSNATIAEAAANSTVVGTASLGGSITGTPTWALTDASGTFSIDSGTGVITVSDNTDLATNASFSVTIGVSGTTPDPSDLVTTIYVLATKATIDLKAASDSGSSNSDDITSVTQPTFTFTATLYTGDFVTFYDSGVAYYSKAISSGEASSKDIVLARTLSDGIHPITATIARGGHENTASDALSITIDTVAPSVTTASTATVAENAHLSIALTANESAAWTISGGADQAQFEISGTTLRWASDGTQNFEVPADANADNLYVVQVSATDAAGNAGNLTITVEVTDVAEGGGSAGEMFGFPFPITKAA